MTTTLEYIALMLLLVSAALFIPAYRSAKTSERQRRLITGSFVGSLGLIAATGIDLFLPKTGGSQLARIIFIFGSAAVTWVTVIVFWRSRRSVVK